MRIFYLYLAIVALIFSAPVTAYAGVGSVGFDPVAARHSNHGIGHFIEMMSTEVHERTQRNVPSTAASTDGVTVNMAELDESLPPQNLAHGPKLDPAPFKVTAAKTQMRWRNMKTGEIISSTTDTPKNLLVRWIEKGKNRSGYWFCLFCANTRTDLDEYAKIWPLETGKSVTYWRYKGNQKWKDKTDVVGTEHFVTPFGAFDTYVVKYTSQAYSHNWSGEMTSWYAPKLGWLVKAIYQDSEGRSWAWEAIDYKAPN